MSLIPFRKQTPAYVGGFDEFDRLFDRFFGNALTNLAAPSPSVTDLALRLDVGETDKAYTVKADLPGVEERDVEVTLNDGVLTLSGEKRHEAETEGKVFHRIERSYGSFRRSLALPVDADENAIRAAMKNGVLAIEIGKKKLPEKTVKKIDVEAK